MADAAASGADSASSGRRLTHKGSRSSIQTKTKGMPIAQRKRSEIFNQNINKRGSATNKIGEKERSGSKSVSPWIIGFLCFVVVGGAVFQVVQSLMDKKIVD